MQKLGKNPRKASVSVIWIVATTSILDNKWAKKSYILPISKNVENIDWRH